MQAAREIVALAEGIEHAPARAAHDAHVQHHVDAVGQFHADLAERRTDRPHREGNHVHGAAAHRTAENLGRFRVRLFRIFPVVGRTGVLFIVATDESLVFHPRHIERVRAMVETPRELFLVQPQDFPGCARFIFKLLLLLLRTVNPDDLVRQAQGSHFLDPVSQNHVGGRTLVSVGHVHFSKVLIYLACTRQVSIHIFLLRFIPD